MGVGVEVTVKLVCLPSEKESTLKGKNLLPLDEQILSFSRRPLFTMGLMYTKANRKSKKLSPM